ncbi:PilZ domain-containing protein [Catenovulum sediminis]|uniref:Cyclic diguanosine monophosphate-binding protein n=1 Tax=Catenovulum sediminis TaxID=1740262 RepID=A0ABV1RL28_9ALTE|nr:PilZ domain-containing protein [Catenovulum sediminis]
MDDRRSFTRIFFSIPAQLNKKNQCWDVNLVDLSLKGALVTLPESDRLPNFEDKKNYQLMFELPNSDVVLEMQVDIAYLRNNQIGLVCTQIDIDSAAHLKRLVELNMGDEALLSRELEHLSSEH